MTSDLSVMRERLRKETAVLLGLDIEHLTAAQSIRLDRAATLRLELDDIESRKLVGAQFDAQKYIAISEALERLMGGDPEVSAINHEHEFNGAFEELSELLSDRAERIDRFNAQRPDVARFNFERELQAVIDKYKAIPPKPTIEWVRDGTHCFFSEGFDPNAEGRRHGFDGWVRPDPPPANADLDASSKPTTPPLAETAQSPQPPLPSPSSAPPAHYLRGPDEPWRSVTSDRCNV